MTGVRGFYSLKILPYDTKAVILFMMVISIGVGVLFSDAIPSFLISYAVFPIGWLCSPVVVTGVSMALAVIPLVSINSSIFEETSSYLGSEALKGKDRIKVAVALMVPIVVLGVLFVVFGDSTLSFLNF